MSHALYLGLMLASVAVPLLRSFESRVRFFSRPWGFAVLVPATLFLAWDEFFVRLGVWGFDPAYILGPKLGNLPLEELFFFVAVPYACLFTHAALGVFQVSAPAGLTMRITTALLGALSLAQGLTLGDRLYPAVTFILAGGVLLGCAWHPPRWWRAFTLSYGICLLPLLLIDGVLTGFVTARPVVWYASNQIWGVRVGTIPIEDFGYFFLMYLPCVGLFEYFDRQALAQRQVTPAVSQSAYNQSRPHLT